MSEPLKRRGRPPAPAKPAVKRWAYATFACEGPISDVLLDEFGKDGWELVSIYVRFDTVYAVFKREIA